MSGPADPSAALGALLEPDRLRVAGALVERALSVDELVVSTDLERRRIVVAIAELRAAGLVEAIDRGYLVPAASLRRLAADIGETATPMDAAIGYGMTDEERAVLECYFSGRTLTQLPTDRPKRLIVLERLALEFDIGQRYTEPEVNDVLRPFHLDVAALRRHLVDEDFLSRERADGQTRYWRSGGRV